MTLNIDSKVELSNGVEIPVFGLGTYLSGGSGFVDAVVKALELGYRHIDTAAFYRNEREIGEAIRKSGIDREEIFITTKLWNNDHGYENALAAFDASLDKLSLDYVDLYLIHYPVYGLRQDSWRALERILDDGRATTIGVSNYMDRHLKELFRTSKSIPTVNQVEFHPFLYQKHLLDFCNSNDIRLEAYSPLTKGRRLNDPRLGNIAKEYSRTPAQILIRWSLQHDLIVIPKSSNPDRIRENAEVFDFSIATEDMKRLNALDEGFRSSWDPSRAP
ncbi:MAG: aldo/keto reductase [Candidatus Thorarchaeota archaeon]|jgi:diketogulonate reductase-like aldo/keto reductase